MAGGVYTMLQFPSERRFDRHGTNLPGSDRRWDCIRRVTVCGVPPACWSARCVHRGVLLLFYLEAMHRVHLVSRAHAGSVGAAALAARVLGVFLVVATERPA